MVAERTLQKRAAWLEQQHATVVDVGLAALVCCERGGRQKERWRPSGAGPTDGETHEGEEEVRRWKAGAAPAPAARCGWLRGRRCADGLRGGVGAGLLRDECTGLEAREDTRVEACAAGDTVR